MASPWAAACFRACPHAVMLGPPQTAAWISAPLCSAPQLQGTRSTMMDITRLTKVTILYYLSNNPF